LQNIYKKSIDFFVRFGARARAISFKNYVCDELCNSRKWNIFLHCLFLHNTLRTKDLHIFLQASRLFLELW